MLREKILKRAPRTSIIRALERLPGQLLEAEHPFANWNDVTAKYFETVRASPSLVARLRELRDETEQDFVEALCEAAGTKDDPIARVLASGDLQRESARRTAAHTIFSEYLDYEIANARYQTAVVDRMIERYHASKWWALKRLLTAGRGKRR